MSKTDHTAEIFEKLGITPDVQPLLFYRYRSPTMENPETQKPISLIHTAGHELRADGLAVRLWMQFYLKKKYGYQRTYISDGQWNFSIGDFVEVKHTSLAHAVHDALCETLGITEEDSQ